MTTETKVIFKRLCRSTRGVWVWCFPAIVLAAGLILMSHAGWFSNAAYAQDAAPAQGGGGRGGRGAITPNDIPLMPPARQLAMKIKGSFDFVGVGDLILRTPLATIPDPGFQAVIKHMKDADVTFANQEGPAIDSDNFSGPMAGAPGTGPMDAKLMGVKIVGTANNHSMDAGIPGMLETIRLLDQAGIAHAGTGRNLQEARAAALLETPKGIVGLVDYYGIDPYSNPALSRESGATYSNGSHVGTPGVDGLHLTPYFTVTQEQLDQLRQIRDSVYARRSEVFAPIPPADPNEPKDKLELFGQYYKVGPKPGNVDYEMNPGDVHEMMRSIRNAKESADFVIFSGHVHEGNYSFQTYTYDNDTPDFLVTLAHQAIDNGADVYVGHGVHTIRGVEIYKGKPIFYGTDTFIYQYGDAFPQNPGGALTEAEASMAPTGFGGERVAQPERLESLLCEAKYDNGRLVEVRIYPLDLGQMMDRPFSRMGVPMTPSPKMAQAVLEKVQRLSERFGTKISIENGVGVIRIAEDQGKAGSSTTTAQR